MADVHILRVFTAENGGGGNLLGVVPDSSGISDARRQEIAARLGFSETVFIDDIASARLRIFTPSQELPLAGHPLVGAAWLLARITGTPVSTLRPVLASEVSTWAEDGMTWIRARISDAPDWQLVELATPGEIDALSPSSSPEYTRHELWSWLDRAAGQVRARVFASYYGVTEDEATGSGALRLVSQLGRALTIHQGAGSLIYARPYDASYAEAGGLVASDGVRTL